MKFNINKAKTRKIIPTTASIIQKEHKIIQPNLTNIVTPTNRTEDNWEYTHDFNQSKVWYQNNATVFGTMRIKNTK